MKKGTVFILSSLLPLCAFANTNPFVDFYVTAGVGGITSNFQVSGNSAIVSIVDSSFAIFNLNNTGNMYANNITGSFGVGYAYCCKKFIFGIEGDVDFFNVSRSQHAFLSDNESLFLNTNLKVELKNSYVFLFRPGWMMDPWTLLYGIIGPRWGNFRVLQNATLHEQFVPVDEQQTVIVNNNLSNNRSTWKMGLTVGAGIEQNIMGNLNASLEYAYTNYGTLSIPSPISASIFEQGVAVAILTNKVNRVKAFTHALELKFFYNFT